MKYAGILLSAYLLLPVVLLAQTGSSCGTAIPLTLDGVIRNYSTSSSNGSSEVCTSFTGSSPVTWFSFTTNSVAACPLLNIATSDNQRCEILLYTSCSGNMNNNLKDKSSMCFDDGQGLWAPSQTDPRTANTTYYIRIKTSTACTISISAQHHTPDNDDCLGATSISTTPVTDNNSCHLGGPEVTPMQLCAYTLENTAFYQFYVATAGPAIININSISCDNGNDNSSNGFQIGFFTGSCGSLVQEGPCSAGSGSFVQATTTSLAAGTKVYVAIDGDLGSNCQYTISGINILGVLNAEGFKNFSVWKRTSSNTLKWNATFDDAVYYEIEKSSDGNNFSSIGKTYKTSGSLKDVDYTFEDPNPFTITYYRVKKMGQNGKISISQIIQSKREIQELKLTMNTMISKNLDMKIETSFTGELNYSIINISGQLFYKGTTNASHGVAQLYKEVSSLPSGKYLILINNKQLQATRTFIKMN